MKTRLILYADEGKILTNGEIYGKEIFLAEESDSSKFYEISEAEYAQKLAEQEKENETM